MKETDRPAEPLPEHSRGSPENVSRGAAFAPHERADDCEHAADQYEKAAEDCLVNERRHELFRDARVWWERGERLRRGADHHFAEGHAGFPPSDLFPPR